MNFNTSDRRAEECVAAFRSLAEVAHKVLGRYAKGQQESEFFGGPLDGLKMKMPADGDKNVGASLCTGRSARYYYSANGDYFFCGWSRETPETREKETK